MNKSDILRGFTLFVFCIGVGAFLMMVITYHHTEPAAVVPVAAAYTDTSTGCEYLVTPQGGITARNNSYGVPGGCRDTADIEAAEVVQ